MIEFVDISKIYSNLEALKEINLEIEEGEFIFLTGPSGSGKTTLIKLLIKEEEPTTGNIFFNDIDLSEIKGKKTAQLRRDIGVVFQDFKLLPNKSLYENISFILEVSDKKKADIEETVKYVLELVELSDRAEAFPDEISGGEKQKIAIARAVANNPKVLIADEPTGNLDPKSSWDIIRLLSKINEWGTTVIMATHGTDIVNTLGKRVIELENGEIISDNKKGAYETPPIKIPQIESDNKKVTKKKINTGKTKKDKKEKEVNNKKEKSKTNGIKEKEFEITFTTKTKTPKTPKKKKKKRKGKDVVDLHKLKLPIEIETILIQENITTIDKLQKTPKLKKIKNLNKEQVKIILNKLAKKKKK